MDKLLQAIAEIKDLIKGTDILSVMIDGTGDPICRVHIYDTEFAKLKDQYGWETQICEQGEYDKEFLEIDGIEIMCLHKVPEELKEAV